LGGSVRLSDYAQLLEKVKLEGVAMENWKYYLDLRKYGPGQTSGYGIGLERLLLYILGNSENDYTIKDMVAYPRFPGNVCP
jgi:asparaginyl-tRNA synthetase